MMNTKTLYLFVCSSFLTILTACNTESTGMVAPQVPVANNTVCMVNNKYMAKVQIAVPVNDKIYYGCCEACVVKLKEDAASRYATDPLSGESVDKADASIIVRPGSTDDVLYFKSPQGAREYLAKMK